MSSHLLSLSLGVALLGVTIASQSAADTIAYSNLRPNLPPSQQGYLLLGTGDDLEGKLAQRFKPTTNGRLSKLELALAYYPTTGPSIDPHQDELRLAIVPDEDGKPASAELWSQLYLNKTGPSDLLNSYDVENGLELQQGTLYWLVATSIPGGQYPYTWWGGTIAPAEPRAHYYIKGNPDIVGKWLVNFSPGRPDSKELGLRVSVSIPEPAAAALMLAASAALLAVRRRTIMYRTGEAC